MTRWESVHPLQIAERTNGTNPRRPWSPRSRNICPNYPARLAPEEAELLAHNWAFLARSDQLPPPGAWTVWLYLAGRGSGKTRAGVEWVRNKIKQGSRRIGLIAPSIAALRDVLIDGESGILAHAWE